MATAAGHPPALTSEQSAALEVRDVRVALSAGAGCGKTFVLTERFLAHLEPADGRDPAAQLGRLIAITFTERAAREMRDRIRRRVRERVLSADDAGGPYWLEIFRRLDSAQISTIHSFCGSLLRSGAVEAGLDPRFGILEPTDAATIVTELVDDELRRRLAGRDPTLLDLTAAYDLAGVRDLIGGVLRERYRLKFDDWSLATPDDLLSRWQTFHHTEVLPVLRRRLREAPAWRDLRRLVVESPAPNGVLAARATTLLELAEVLKNDADKADGATELGTVCAAIVEHARMTGVGGKKEWSGLEGVKLAYQETLTALRDTAKKILPDASFDPVACRPAAVAALALLRLVAPIAAAYEARKRELGKLDFDDLLLKARDLLCDPQSGGLRRRAAHGLELLLVDECQDVDPLQAELIETLAGGKDAGGKLFFVGDFKQSIYRFRRADPRVFRGLRDATPAAGRLPLTLNFRSQPAVLDFVNGLFGGLFGTEYEPLRAHRPQQTPLPAVEFMWCSPEADGAAPGADAPATAAGATEKSSTGGTAAEGTAGEPPAEEERESPGGEPPGAERLRRVEAEWIARRIRELVDSGRPMVPATAEKSTSEKSKTDEPKGKPADPHALRPVEYGDVAILFRAMSNVAIYESALERHGIPYYVVGGKAFYAQQEIYDLLNFLRTLDSACDEVALAGVLRSPFFALRDETLLWLSGHDDGLAAGLMSEDSRQKIDADERPRVEFAARTIRELREVKNRLPIAPLVDELLARTAYDAALTAEFLGTRKLANLRKLLDLARDFDRSGIFTLTDFIAQLSDFVVRQPDEALAATHAEGTNVVRLMTIHQSKGLEFPVVVVPDLNRKANGHKDSFAYHDELGPVVRSPVDDGALDGLRLFRLAEHPLAEAESLRVFYVAATRAADYLILSAGTRGDERINDWRDLLATSFDATTGRLLGPWPADRPRPQVRVTTTIPPRPAKTERAPRPDWPKLLDEAIRTAAGPDATLPHGTEPVAPRLASRRKFSFSRLSGELHPVGGAVAVETEPTTVAAGSPDPLPPADDESGERGDRRDFGTLVHAVLATVDFARPAEIEPLVARHARAWPQCTDADRRRGVEVVRRFVESPRGREIAAAGRVHRELEFLLAWPPAAPRDGKQAQAGRTANRPHDDGVYVQGFIDLLYETADGRLHLVDFKTPPAPRDPASAAAPYEMQLHVYAAAVEQILGRAPDEIVVSFLRGGGEHTFAWDDTARRRTREAITGAVVGHRAAALPLNVTVEPGRKKSSPRRTQR